MGKQADGGPAFPCSRLEPIEYSNPEVAAVCASHGEVSYSGLSLRDYFAAQALVMYGAMVSPNQPIVWPEFLKDIGKVTYQVADAMLKEREKA